jgi:hypothetical protein
MYRNKARKYKTQDSGLRTQDSGYFYSVNKVTQIHFHGAISYSVLTEIGKKLYL